MNQGERLPSFIVSIGYFSLSDIFGGMAAMDGRKLAGVKHSQLVLAENAATLLRMEV